MVSIVRISETECLVKINVYKVEGHTRVLFCVCAPACHSAVLRFEVPLKPAPSLNKQKHVFSICSDYN